MPLPWSSPSVLPANRPVDCETMKSPHPQLRRAGFVIRVRQLRVAPPLAVGTTRAGVGADLPAVERAVAVRGAHERGDRGLIDRQVVRTADRLAGDDRADHRARFEVRHHQRHPARADLGVGVAAQVDVGGQDLFHVLVAEHAEGDLFDVVVALRSPGRFAGRLDRGQSSATKMPMMAITTSSSTNVNPIVLRWPIPNFSRRNIARI